MANVRPKKKGSHPASEVVDEEISSDNKSGQSRSYFGDAFDNMHYQSFGNEGLGGNTKSGQVQIDSPKVVSLEDLVTTLAHLQFVTKGRISEDGKVEIVFCSPDPVVTAEVPKVERVQYEQSPPQVTPRRRHHSRGRRQKRVSFF